MKNKLIMQSIFALTLALGVVGCGNSKAKQINWDFSKEEAAEAIGLNVVSSFEGEEARFLIANYEAFLSDKLTKDDIIFFDLLQAGSYLTDEENDIDYLDYQTIKSCEIEYTNIITDESKTRFTIVAPLQTTEYVGVIVNKDKVLSNKYVIAANTDILNIDSDLEKTAQEEFEEKYAKSNRAIVGPLVSGFVAAFVNIIGAVAMEQPVLIFSGFIEIIKTITGAVTGYKEPGIRDVLEKLFQIDKRIRDLDKKVTENFNILRRDEKLTQSYVNQVLLAQYDKNIKDYESNYKVKLESYNDSMSILVRSGLRDVALTKGRVIQIPYYYDEGVISYRVLTEVAAHPDDNVIEITVPEFKQAKAILSTNNNTFSNEVMTAFQNDIYDATEKTVLPQGMSRELLTDYAVGRLVQEYTKAYYSKGRSKEAIAYTTLVVETCKQFNGGAGTSILYSYENRLKYMYNFGSEMKPAFNTAVCDIRTYLANNCALALEALYWTSNPSDNLMSQYNSAISSIADLSDEVNKIDDHYSFILKRKVSATVYSTHTDSYYTTHSNYPQSYNQLHIYKYEGSTISEVSEVAYNDFDPVKADDQYSLILRMNQLVDSHVLNATTYQNYLMLAGILNENTPDIITDGIAKNVINNNPFRFITEITHRTLTNEDANKYKCYFTDKCLEKAYYFNVGQYYSFKGSRTSEYWHASVWESDFIDANTGKVIADDRLVGLEGTYDEGHWNWKTDEKYRFNDGPGNRFFLGLAYIAD